MSDYRGAAFPPSLSPSAPGAQSGDHASPSEAALHGLREQRIEIAQRIGEHLYRMVMGGMLHDPAVIAACRPLYEMEQQILRMEAALGTSGANAPSLTQAAPPVIVAPPHPAQDREAMSTALTPGDRSASQSGSGSSESARGVPHAHHGHAPQTADRVCGHCHMPLQATDRVCPVCGRDTTNAVSLAATPVQAAQCARCNTVLQGHDHVCPVCGTARTR